MSALNFNNDYILENEVVLLRPLLISDETILAPILDREPELWKYSPIIGDEKETMLSYLQTAVSGRDQSAMYSFIVKDKRTNKYVGSSRFYNYNDLHQTALIGYTWYSKEYQGTGLNKNCKYLMLQFAFEQLKLERIEFQADNKNERSIASMKSIGCTVEGVLRQVCAMPEGRRDSIVLSILRGEWFDRVKPNLEKKIKAL